MPVRNIQPKPPLVWEGCPTKAATVGALESCRVVRATPSVTAVRRIPFPPTMADLTMSGTPRVAARALFHWAGAVESWFVSCRDFLLRPQLASVFKAMGQQIGRDFRDRRAAIESQNQGDRVVENVLSSVGIAMTSLQMHCDRPALVRKERMSIAARLRPVKVTRDTTVPGVLVPPHARELAELVFAPLETAAIRSRSDAASSLTYVVPPGATAPSMADSRTLRTVLEYYRYWPYDPSNADLAFVLDLLGMRMTRMDIPETGDIRLCITHC